MGLHWKEDSTLPSRCTWSYSRSRVSPYKSTKRKRWHKAATLYSLQPIPLISISQRNLNVTRVKIFRTRFAVRMLFAFVVVVNFVLVMSQINAGVKTTLTQAGLDYGKLFSNCYWMGSLNHSECSLAFYNTKI